MQRNDPLTPLVDLPGVAQAAEQAVAAIARVHRRPSGLRQPEVISSESLLRGARASLGVQGKGLVRNPQPADMEEGPLADAISAYSVLAPELASTTVRTFARSPLQVLARIDVAAGGTGAPQQNSAQLQALARLIGRSEGVDFDRLLPVVITAEIMANQFFGDNSLLVACVAGRVAAVHTGFDPRGFAIPELYLHRNTQRLEEGIAKYAQYPAELLVVLLEAWEYGAQEADGIARSL